MVEHKPAASAPGRRAVIGTLAALGSAATLAAMATPAMAQGEGAPKEQTGGFRPSSPRRLMAAFYSTYNGDLAGGFARYI
ncbi:hypothetical protein ACNPQM_21745 [Streptomyces sp. NPDC056231]|uniref:hypothetical protein n=1 Tax=Streptomyces sp. NPDC056231 TaxID=3345755 RepID=UPI003AB03384